MDKSFMGILRFGHKNLGTMAQMTGLALNANVALLNKVGWSAQMRHCASVLFLHAALRIP